MRAEGIGQRVGAGAGAGEGSGYEPCFCTKIFESKHFSKNLHI